MHKLPIFVLAACVVGTHVSAGSEPVSLPADPQVSVVELWYLGEEAPSEPEVAVFADGRICSRSPAGPSWCRMSRSELLALVTELLHGDELCRCDSRKLAQEIRSASERSGLTAEIPGAGETVIRIRTADAVYEVRCPAVGILATRFPHVQGLQQLLTAQRRLENLRAVTLAGGAEAAAKLARAAQEQMEREHGVTIEITSADLSIVRLLPDGSRYCQFLVLDSSQNPHSARILSLFDTPGAVPRVTLLGEGPAIR